VKQTMSDTDAGIESAKWRQNSEIYKPYKP